MADSNGTSGLSLSIQILTAEQILPLSLRISQIKQVATLKNVKEGQQIVYGKPADSFKVRCQTKKNNIIWEFFPNVGPPPLLGTPYPKKMFKCLFCILGP